MPPFVHRLLLPPLMAAATAGHAAPPQQNPIVARVLTCRGTSPDSARLACYDKAAAVLGDALVQHDVTVLDKEDIRQTRRSLFGFTLPNLASFGLGAQKDEKAPDVTTLDSTVRSVRSASYGKWDIELEEHAVWRNVDQLDVAPRTGDKVHLKKALLGSYFMTIGNDRSIRAVRVR